MENNSEIKPELRWHVPTASQLPLRLQLKLILCLTVVLSVIGWVTANDDARWATVITIAVLGILLASWKLIAIACQPRPQPNVWLNELGLNWLNRAGEVCSLPHETVTSFWIGIDAGTRFQVPSLTFLLRDGFLSQPLELYSPATPDSVREWLVNHWRLTELTELPPANAIAVALEIVFDEVKQIWIFDGAKPELEKLLAAWLDLAKRVPLPPPGARPLEFVIACREMDCGIILAADCWIDDATLSIPPDKLRALVEVVSPSIQANEDEVLYSLTCDNGLHWRLLFKVNN